MKIITITLNPAFDVHCRIDSFVPFHENLATVTERDAGGKGVNISRALSANGTPNLAFLVLGEENASDFTQCLAKENIKTRGILVSGRIRENITIHESNARETRISFSGFSINKSLLNNIEREILSILKKEDFVTFTGRVPNGINMEDVTSFLKKMKDAGAKIILDSRSFEKQDILQVKPWLIKPNQEEISHYSGTDIQSKDEAISAAIALKDAGIDNVLISLGEQGAILVCSDGIFEASAPKIQVLSTIGAGDSSIAGFLTVASQGGSAADCLKTAVAYGSAACLQKGTQAPDGDDIQKMIREITVTKR